MIWRKAVVPLQTHGCYNYATTAREGSNAVVPLQTHGCYNVSPAAVTTRRSRGSPTDSRVL